MPKDAICVLGWGFQVVQLVKNLPAMQETQETCVRSLGWEDPLEGVPDNPFQFSCLENPHGQRSLAGYRLWRHKESDVTKQLSTYTHRMEVSDSRLRGFFFFCLL